jgi:glycosyltransferase involved in cell wall biosynthesis
MARFFSQMDVFADFSSYQAMGLTALEAMACGAAVIVPQEGGSISFARHGENALLTDTHDERKCFESLAALIEDNNLRQKIQQVGLFDACAYYPEKAAFNMLQLIFR